MQHDLNLKEIHKIHQELVSLNQALYAHMNNKRKMKKKKELVSHSAKKIFF
jgi:hypothetical protein